MNRIMKRGQREHGARRACLAIALSLSLGVLSACDSLLEVDLPSSLTDEVLDRPDAATTLLVSAIAHFEKGYDTYVWQAFGHEDGGQGMLTGSRNPLRYTVYADWFADIAKSRNFAFHLHDKLEKDWTVAQVPDRNRYLAISSIYAGAALGWAGASLCEVTVDLGPLMTPDQTYAMAEAWLTKALTEITAAGGDFAVPYGIAPSAETMAYGLRAQVRWMKGDNAGALADARRVPQGFVANVTRAAGPARRNTPYYLGTFQRYAQVSGVNDWWQGPPNPVTGQPWPAIIPFTGYLDLGILPDGRAVRDDGLPIRTAGPHRTPVESTAIPDTRVRTQIAPVAGAAQGPIPIKYAGENSSIPLVNWKEMWLIRAELEGGQTAIDLVNQIRVADNLPRVTYASPGNAQQIKYMIIEERRRALFLEGRFYFTKLKNLDLLWFPRAVGRTTISGWVLGGGVRFLMPQNEYILNSNLTLDMRATGCAASNRPTALDADV